MPATVDPIATENPQEPATPTVADDADSPAATPPETQPADNTESPAESLDRLYGNPAQPPQPTPPPPAAAPGKYAVPPALGARHPDGGLIAMRLLSRMQRDLAELTQDKRPATYEEVDKFLGHALVAERIAPRGYSAEQATRWWDMGGSAVLHASANGAGDNRSIPSDMTAQDAPRPAELDSSRLRDEFASVQVHARDDAPPGSPEPDSSENVSFGGEAESEATTDPNVAQPDTAGTTTEDASEELADPVSSTPSAAGAKIRPANDSKARVDEAIEQSKKTIYTTKAAAKTRVAAPPGTDLSTYDKGFGDTAHAFHGDYRTTSAARAWLSEFERLAKPDMPYPDGSPIGEAMTAAKRQSIREEVAYLYTLPEVKAFLDLIAHGEGADKDGYYLSHGMGRPRLPDLDTFHRTGNEAKGRYQIQPGPWRDYGGALWSRTDFSEITQDLIAITQLKFSGAIDELMKGNLSGALTLASPIFASVPVSATEDYSRYPITRYPDGPKGKPVTELQPTPTHFRDLSTVFADHLRYRQAEFKQAEQAWRTHQTLPKAFIPPLRWQSFGLSGFDRPPEKAN